MTTDTRLSRAVTAAKAASHELEFGNVADAADFLEDALKQVYAMKKTEPPLVSTEGQGRE